ncbi:MAG: hypothetical protein HY815_26250 [Candidatus Riflebacteria bacterium]|nr:hypothetical protein [Candidatus Riflebacteria bacterium]
MIHRAPSRLFVALFASIACGAGPIALAELGGPTGEQPAAPRDQEPGDLPPGLQNRDVQETRDRYRKGLEHLAVLRPDAVTKLGAREQASEPQYGEESGQTLPYQAAPELTEQLIKGYDKIAVLQWGVVRATPGLQEAMNLLQSGSDDSTRDRVVKVLEDTVRQIETYSDRRIRVGEGLEITTVKSGGRRIPGLQAQAARQALDLARDRSVRPCALRDAVSAALKASSPVVLDMDGDGRLDVTTPALGGPFVRSGSTSFDLAGSGRGGRFEWLLPGQDGLLVLDSNGNGVADSASELFGDSDRFAHGYAKLELLDSNRDRRLTGRELSRLSVWIDDGDGLCQPRELEPVFRLGISSIGVGHRDLESWFVRNGRTFKTWDWCSRGE